VFFWCNLWSIFCVFMMLFVFCGVIYIFCDVIYDVICDLWCDFLWCVLWCYLCFMMWFVFYDVIYDPFCCVLWCDLWYVWYMICFSAPSDKSLTPYDNINRWWDIFINRRSDDLEYGSEHAKWATISRFRARTRRGALKYTKWSQNFDFFFNHFREEKDLFTEIEWF